jgi:hypothetical protein
LSVLFPTKHLQTQTITRDTRTHAHARTHTDTGKDTRTHTHTHIHTHTHTHTHTPRNKNEEIEKQTIWVCFPQQAKHLQTTNTHTCTTYKHIHTLAKREKEREYKQVNRVFSPTATSKHCKSSLPRGGPDGGAPGGPIDTRHYITKLRGRHSALQTRHQPPGGPV